MSLDECTPYPAEKTVARKSMELSLRWAARCKEEFVASKPKYGKEQFLFAIGQGSMYPDLRKEYIEKALEIGFDAYAMGGMSVGEPAEMMYDITDISTDSLPKGKARYLMGVGTPENILESIDRGVDMFDCVMPTRNARNGQLFTTHGKINIRNAKYKLSDDCIDDGISSYASNNYSLGYMRHLFIANEILGLQIASMHNIAFYLWLTATAREKIIDGTFIQWKKETIEKMSSSKA
jgi:queuine tRNA-ribosyltransferase